MEFFLQCSLLSLFIFIFILFYYYYYYLFYCSRVIQSVTVFSSSFYFIFIQLIEFLFLSLLYFFSLFFFLLFIPPNPHSETVCVQEPFQTECLMGQSPQVCGGEDVYYPSEACAAKDTLQDDDVNGCARGECTNGQCDFVAAGASCTREWGRCFFVAARWWST